MPAEREIVIQVENLVDLLPEKFSGEPESENCEEFFRKFKIWLDFHPSKFDTDLAKVKSIHYCLSLTASEWWSKLPAAELPATVDELETIFLQKFKTAKTRQQLKAEVHALKYEPGKPFRNMVNKFQTISNRLEWSLILQLEKFIRILPIGIRQFVVSRPYDNFEDICKSLTLYQQMIEVENVVSVFKNVSFSNICDTCGESHESSACPSNKPVEVPEIPAAGFKSYDRHITGRRNSCSPNRPHTRSPSPYSRSRDFDRSRERGRNYPQYSDQNNYHRPRRQSYSPGGERYRYQSPSYDQHRERSNSGNFRYRSNSGDLRYRNSSNSRYHGDRYRSNSGEYRNRNRSSSRDSYNRRPISRDRYQYDNYRGQNFRSNSRDRSYKNYDNSYDHSQNPYDNYRNYRQRYDNYETSSPQRGNNRSYRGRNNYRSYSSPGIKRSYHTDESVLPGNRNNNIVINGVKYAAIDSQMAASNSDFH
jgi:hypothetical protein